VDSRQRAGRWLLFTRFYELLEVFERARTDERIPFEEAEQTIDAIPAIEEPGLKEMQTARHKVHWEKGTRRATGVELELVPPVGEPLRIVGESIARFQMFGIGYQHPEWGHAVWKGELVTGAEHFDHDELDPLEFKNIHVHHVVRARLGDQVGVGTLETVVIGRHTPSGFQSFFDGAP